MYTYEIYSYIISYMVCKSIILILTSINQLRLQVLLDVIYRLVLETIKQNIKTQLK